MMVWGTVVPSPEQSPHSPPELLQQEVQQARSAVEPSTGIMQPGRRRSLSLPGMPQSVLSGFTAVCISAGAVGVAVWGTLGRRPSHGPHSPIRPWQHDVQHLRSVVGPSIGMIQPPRRRSFAPPGTPQSSCALITEAVRACIVSQNSCPIESCEVRVAWASARASLDSSARSKTVF